jgi:hypothetical protein
LQAPWVPQHVPVDLQPRQRRTLTEPIDKVTGTGVATTDGATCEVDVLNLATSFTVMDVDIANSYYFDKNGDVPLRPTSTPEAVWRSRRFPLEDYEFST